MEFGEPVEELVEEVSRYSLVIIDFPQMVSTSHANAAELFDRDVECLHTFFHRKYGVTSDFRWDN